MRVLLDIGVNCQALHSHFYDLSRASRSVKTFMVFTWILQKQGLQDLYSVSATTLKMMG